MRRLTSLVALIILVCEVAASFAGRLIARVADGGQTNVDPLVAALAGADAQARQDAADQLTALGSAAKAAVPALSHALTDANAELRWRAARALAAIGPGASAALPALIAALGDSEPLVRAQSWPTPCTDRLVAP